MEEGRQAGKTARAFGIREIVFSAIKNNHHQLTLEVKKCGGRASSSPSINLFYYLIVIYC
jgi:hypothetical protein